MRYKVAHNVKLFIGLVLKVWPFLRTAQEIRASFLARAAASLFLCSLCAACSSHGPKLKRCQYEELFCLGSVRLQAAQGPRPDRQPGVCRHQGGERIQGKDHGAEPALAD